MDSNGFYKQYHRFMKQQANDIIRRYRAPEYLFDDCINAGYVIVCQHLPKWDRTRSNSPLSYLYLGIRGAMQSVCLNNMHYTGRNHRVRACQYVFSQEDSVIPIDKNEHYGMTDYENLSVEESIDLKRAVQMQMRAKPVAMSHFMCRALDKSIGKNYADDTGLKRRNLTVNLKQIKDRLKRALE